jgi:hypothetical protein
MPRAASRHSTAPDVGAQALEIATIVGRPRDPFVPVYRPFDPNREDAEPSPLPDSPLQADLRRLRDLLTPRALECLSAAVASAVLLFLAGVIVHEIPDCGRLPAPVQLGTPLVLDAHALAIACAKGLPPAKLAPFEAPAFHRGLVRMFASPDAEEQQRVSSLMAALCQALPDAGAALLPLVRAGLAQASAAFLPHHFIRPACEFLHRYHSDPLHFPDDPDWFLAVCPALFASERLPAYAEALVELCDHYYDVFERLPAAVARYLVAHWPRANPAKAGAFVEHAGALLGRMTDADAGAVAHGLFGCLAEALASGNDGAAQAVAALLARRGFARRFRLREKALAPIRAGLMALAGGAAAVAIQAQTALEQLPAGGAGADEIDRQREATWMAIWECRAETDAAREAFRESLVCSG